MSNSNKNHLTKSSFEEMDANMDGKVDLKEFVTACARHNYIIFHYLKVFVATYQQKFSDSFATDWLLSEQIRWNGFALIGTNPLRQICSCRSKSVATDLQRSRL